VLEVGSVPLLFSAALAATDYRLTGVDLDPSRFSAAIERLGLDIQTCDIERSPLPFEGGLFDAVVFNEIFEHLRIDPIFTVSELGRVLRPGGQLLLSTPNLRSLSGLVNFLLRGRGYGLSADPWDEYTKLRKLGHMGHVREYTTSEVTRFLDNSGLTPRRIIYRGRYRPLLARLATGVLPGLRPFFTVVASREAAS
jgi:SAM-dependent methyltransferase